MERETKWASQELDRLLAASSRTFALAVPLLPEPTRRQVTIAYLLFRIADTFEDATAWPPARRIEALERFSRLLERPDRVEIQEAARRWAEEVPCEEPGYRDLLAEMPFVFAEFLSLSPAPSSWCGPIPSARRAAWWASSAAAAGTARSAWRAWPTSGGTAMRWRASWASC
jgi:Squalene/phytoene synthase